MTRICKNCGASNEGAYCVDCGQPTAVKLLTVGELVSETLAAVYNLDSRVWRTLRPLIFSPGKLTNEYIAGRRASYVPPFRTYLVFSLLFFLVVSFDVVSVGRDISPEVAADVVAQLRDDGVADTDRGRAAIRALAENGVISREDAESLLLAPLELRGAGASQNPPARASTGTLEVFDTPFSTPADCDAIEWGRSVGAPFGGRLLRACQRTLAAGIDALFRRALDHSPVLVFISLPLVAGFMKLIYWFPRRRYVEHLTFLFHTHAFFFALMLVLWLGARLAELVSWLSVPIGILIGVGWVYVPIYLFVAMRRVYRQSRWLTAVKYCVLGPVYLSCLALTFVGGIVFAFVTI